MTPEINPLDPALEQAVSEIRDIAVDEAAVEAAAARVWEKLVAEAPELGSAHLHLRTCADFQGLIPDFRAGRLTEGRAALVRDHLHECVACRKVYEGRVVTMPAPARRPTVFPMRWAAAAVVVIAAGTAVWFAISQYSGSGGRAFVQTVNGTLYEVSPNGLVALAAGADLPEGVELRTAKDSDAMVQLRDGSVVELRERSGLSATRSGTDLTVHLVRGSIIVQAAKRRSGHLYVATPDCRVAVTGTIFSVSAGVKGSRVSVVQGEVRVSQDNREDVLYPGQQHVSSASLEPLAVRDDISWSRNREKLLQQLASLSSSLQQIHLPALRYSSKLLDRLPANTVFFASIPNLGDYLQNAQAVLHQKMAESPELRSWWAARGEHNDEAIGKMLAASQYLGDEIAVVGLGGQNGMPGMFILAETRRDGFGDFLKKEMPAAAIETRPGLVAFSFDRPSVGRAVEALDTPSNFKSMPFHAAIEQSYERGAGLLLCADLGSMGARPLPNVRYFIAEQKEVGGQMETHASLGFDGPRTGIAAWLASPSPMGALDYVSPDATFLTAFVVKSPAAIVDELVGVQQRSQAAAERGLDEFKRQYGIDVRNDLGASLGGEFAVAVDGPVMPVPSWKLVTEVYDPARIEATLEKAVAAYNQAAQKNGQKPLRTSRETVDGRTYYMIASAVQNPLTEAHYTFADGYLIAAPSRALVSKALQVKASGTSISHSAQFLAMTPRDHYANFSAVMYQNLGTTLAPIASLLGSFAPPDRKSQDALASLSNVKPTMFAVYGEPDRITISGNSAGIGGLSNILGGNLLGLVGGAMPFGQFSGSHGPGPQFRFGEMPGTPHRQPAYK